MDRLTQEDWREKSQGGIPWSVHPVQHIDDLLYYKRLAAYEDTGFTPEQVVEMAKELAELKKQLPPCKVGDTVYYVNNHYRIYGDYKVDEEKVELLISDGEDWGADMGGPKDGVFGETVFLTKEEAEAKLKEMEGE